jgi:hypothetical protein
MESFEDVAEMLYVVVKLTRGKYKDVILINNDEGHVDEQF